MARGIPLDHFGLAANFKSCFCRYVPRPSFWMCRISACDGAMVAAFCCLFSTVRLPVGAAGDGMTLIVACACAGSGHFGLSTGVVNCPYPGAGMEWRAVYLPAPGRFAGARFVFRRVHAPDCRDEDGRPFYGRLRRPVLPYLTATALVRSNVVLPRQLGLLMRCGRFALRLSPWRDASFAHVSSHGAIVLARHETDRLTPFRGGAAPLARRRRFLATNTIQSITHHLPGFFTGSAFYVLPQPGLNPSHSTLTILSFNLARLCTDSCRRTAADARILVPRAVRMARGFAPRRLSYALTLYDSREFHIGQLPIWPAAAKVFFCFPRRRERAWNLWE